MLRVITYIIFTVSIIEAMFKHIVNVLEEIYEYVMKTLELPNTSSTIVNTSQASPSSNRKKSSTPIICV